MFDIEAIAIMRKEGMTYEAIMARTGLSHWAVSNMVRQAKDAGLLAERKLGRNKTARRCRLYDKYAVTEGRVSEIYTALDDEQFDWLASEAAKIGCESITEYLTELVRDAHAEATA